MRQKIDADTGKAVSFLKMLSGLDHVKWPHDFDVCEPSDEELAKTFGYWFGGQRWSTSGDTFSQFGEDGTGSMFLLWYYPGLNAKPPVVYLGSEGDSSLLATNIEDFIRQLGSGKLLFDCAWLEPSPDEVDESDWCELRRIIQEKIGFSDETPEHLADNARRDHPDFTQWVSSMGEY